jgi:hypothetical protein
MRMLQTCPNEAQEILYELTTNGINDPKKLNHIYPEEDPAALYKFKKEKIVLELLN